MPRLFIAVPLPRDVAAEIEPLFMGLPDTSWTEREGLHLTLRFIGEVDNPTFLEIGAGLRSISSPPFDLTLKGIGHFPPRGSPTSLWVGVEPQPGLTALRRQIERMLATLGLEPEQRRFAPHVSIARFRRPPPVQRFASFLMRSSLFRSSPFPVSHFGLYSSVLRPEGALHVREAEYDFVAGTILRE